MKESSKIHLYYIVEKTTVLGKGNRFAIWVQGCLKRCPGCLAVETWDKKNSGYYCDVKTLSEKIIKTNNISGVTISGGEPFLQSAVLTILIKLIKKVRPELNYIVYTGYKYDLLLRNKTHRKFIENIDLLIDGEYVVKLDDNLPLVGSANQKVYILSDEGLELALFMQKKEVREIEFVFTSPYEIFMVGLPNNKYKKLLTEKK